MKGGALLRDPVIVDLSRRHGKTPAQVVLRWDLQSGVVTIPKTSHAERMRENADLFDFALTDVEMNAIARLDQNLRSGADPANVQF